MGLGDFRVAQPFDNLHLRGGTEGFREGLMQKQRRAERGCMIEPLPHPQAKEAVAIAQMMVEKRQRRADREGVQPQGDLCELDRHHMLVHAVDAALQNHATDNMPVVELLVVNSPTTLIRVADNGCANCCDTGVIDGERIARVFERGNHACPVTGALSQSDFALSRREPFDLLKLHSVPRRITDHGIEAAAQTMIFPIRGMSRCLLKISKRSLRIEIYAASAI